MTKIDSNDEERIDQEERIERRITNRLTKIKKFYSKKN